PEHRGLNRVGPARLACKHHDGDLMKSITKDIFDGGAQRTRGRRHWLFRKAWKVYNHRVHVCCELSSSVPDTQRVSNRLWHLCLANRDCVSPGVAEVQVIRHEALPDSPGRAQT